MDSQACWTMPVNPVRPCKDSRDHQVPNSHHPNVLWRSSADTSGPDCREKCNHRPECVHCHVIRRSGHMHVNCYSNQPKSAFHRIGKRDGIPNPQAVLRLRPRRKRHVGTVTQPVENPVAENRQPQDTCFLQVLLQYQVRSRKQPSPNEVHEQTVADRKVI